ncbi:unnamed protein product [Calicophoron daubneyi]|uniref:Phosphoinositide phospholipase C n=1 Tax=Calicophoron daubneyi TaxID=300641 RepID=A0AAV2T8G8_CALDB
MKRRRGMWSRSSWDHKVMWLERIFSEADQTNSGYLSEFEALRLIRSFNPNLSSSHLRQQLKEIEHKSRDHKGRLDKADFIQFYKKIATRQEVYYILVRYASGSELLTRDDLRYFMESEEGRLGVTDDQCNLLIECYEPSSENRDMRVMGIDGFTNLLLSQECDIFNPMHLQVCQDMSQPITHYYLAASHKTFLLEDQLTGPCSVEGYQRALLSGCRYIEVEVYDGHDGHPVVRRANSRPSGIPVQVVLETIVDYAFVRSEYPVIVSVECFASPAQQLTLATLIRCCFGQRLLLPSAEFLFNLSESQLEVEEQVEHAYRKNSLTTVDISNESTVYTSDGMSVRWPSPRDLLGRILLQGKRLPKGTPGNGTSEAMNGRSAGSRRLSHYTPSNTSCSIIRELSDLFFIDSTNYSGIPTIDSQKAGMNIFVPGLFASPYVRLRSEGNNSQSFRTRSSLVLVGGHNEVGFPTSAPPNPATTNPFGSANHTSQPKVIQEKSRVHPYHFVLITESEASKALGYAAGELVQITRKSFLKVLPSPSRADSSNLNPVDIWAWGGQVVPLNYQTAGLVMDLATGFFARNGACGYVLKPALYRQPSSFFTPLGDIGLDDHRKPPDTTPQILRLKILSAQQLPKPRGSVSKGDTIEPYVVVEIHGIPVDCTEQRTCTAPAGSACGYNATFDDTFEFCVQLGDLALVRFVVLDDHAIGDDFIGQNTIPFDCLLPGYRHVRLRSDTGEPIPLATLFIHVAVMTKTDDGEESHATGVLQRWRARKQKHVQLKKTGASSFDEVFKSASATLHQVHEIRTSLLTAFDAFRRACGETSGTMSMTQCIRSLASKLTATCGNPEMWPIKMRIRPEDELPHLEIQSSSPLFGSNLSVFPSLSTLGDTVSRTSSVRFSPSPNLQRSPSLVASQRSFLSRRLKQGSKSIDEESTSALSMDGAGLSVNNSNATRELSPMNPPKPRRSSIQSSTSSISSLSMGGVDKMRRIMTEFESLVESCKIMIKQGPYLRAKLQNAQRTALEAYTKFLEGLKEPTGQLQTSTFGGLRRNVSSDNSPYSASDQDSQSSHSSARRIIRPDKKGEKESRDDRKSSSSGGGSTLYWRKMSRIADSVTWNLRLLTGQAELVSITLKDLNNWLLQARESGVATGLLPTDIPSAPDDSVDKIDSASSISDSMQMIDTHLHAEINLPSPSSPSVSEPDPLLVESKFHMVAQDLTSIAELPPPPSYASLTSPTHPRRIHTISESISGQEQRPNHSPSPKSVSPSKSSTKISSSSSATITTLPTKSRLSRISIHFRRDKSASKSD